MAGWLVSSILSMSIAMGVIFYGVAYLSGTLSNLQSLCMAVGLVLPAVTLGAYYGSAVLLGYTTLLSVTYLQQKNGYFSNPVPLRPHTQYLVALVMLTLLFVICALVRKRLIDSYKSAIKDRDSTREKLEVSNKKLEELLVEKSTQLDVAVKETGRILTEHAHLESINAMVYGISHELGSPIGNAVLMASTMSDWAAEIASIHDSAQPRMVHLAERMLEGCNIISRNLEKADSLVNSFKQMSSEQSASPLKGIDLEAAIEDSLFMLKPLLKEYGVTITRSLSRGLALLAPQGIVQQIVTNLVSNAVLHGFSGEPAEERLVSIRTLVKPADSKIAIIEVSDNGCGMSSDVQGRVFDPFFTTRRGAGGMGIGLSIVHNLVTITLMGRITVNSSPKGTTFTVEIPILTPACIDAVDDSETTPVYIGCDRRRPGMTSSEFAALAFENPNSDSKSK